MLLRNSLQHRALAQRVSHTGSTLHDITTGVSQSSDELFRLLGVSQAPKHRALRHFSPSFILTTAPGCATREAKSSPRI